MSLLPWEGKEGETLPSPASPTDNGHPEPAVTVGGDGGMRNGCQFGLPYVAAVERSSDSKNYVSAMSREAQHYAEGPSGVLGGAASLGSHRGAQRRAFTTLSLIVGEKQKVIL